MITDFEFFNPFARVTEICTGHLNLGHEEIASYMRRKLGGYSSYTSYFDGEFNERMVAECPQAKQMMNAIEATCIMFAKERGVDLNRCGHREVQLWFSEYLEGERHTLHNHPRAVVAGTYYPYADEDSCDIRFRHPSSGMLQVAQPWTEDDKRDGMDSVYKLQPKTGMINVWPAWMEHEIGPQKKVLKEKSRLAISFNWGRIY